MYSHESIFKWKTIISQLDWKYYWWEIFPFGCDKYLKRKTYVVFQFEDLLLNDYLIDLLLLLKTRQMCQRERTMNQYTCWKCFKNDNKIRCKKWLRTHWWNNYGIMFMWTNITNFTYLLKKIESFFCIRRIFTYTSSKWIWWKNEYIKLLSNTSNKIH